MLGRLACGGFLGVVLGVFLLASSASATEEAAIKMPPTQFGCTACHAHAGATPEKVFPGAEMPLTPMGLDWQLLASVEADREWLALAAGNSDQDGCTNGYEMGDPGGTFLPGGQLPPDRVISDPNRSDCTLPISPESWSRLKSLFDR